jgi:hypothetical protein
LLSGRSVLLASNYNVWREPFNGQSQSFLNVVRQVEERADLVAPGGAAYLSGHAVRPSLRYLAMEFSHRVTSQARLRLGRHGLSNMVVTEIEKNYDLFFFCCQFPHELPALDRLRDWRKRTGWAACYMLESWSSSLAATAGNLRILDQFDQVFVLNGQSIPELSRYTKTKIAQLSPATDVALATPMPTPSPRTIDVYSFGRRSPGIHEQLLQISCKRPDFFYVYDTVQGGTIPDWLDHRSLTASHMKRARFFIAFNPMDIGGGGRGEFRNEQALSTRYFEGAAGGAVMLGSPPQVPDFQEHFGWPDSVIALTPDGNIEELLAELLQDEERLQTVSHRNVAESLRRHDWSHRWEQVLSHVGLEGSAALQDRHGALRRLSELPYQWT